MLRQAIPGPDGLAQAGLARLGTPSLVHAYWTWHPPPVERRRWRSALACGRSCPPSQQGPELRRAAQL